MTTKDRSLHSLSRYAQAIASAAGLRGDEAVSVAGLLATRATVSAKELLTLVARDSPHRASALSGLERTGLIRPVKASGRLADRSQGAYARYHVEPWVSPDTSELITRIRRLDPRLWQSGSLLTSPGFYVEYCSELLALSDYLGSPAIARPMTLRERCYDIWGDEHALEADAVRDLRPLMAIIGTCGPDYPLLSASPTRVVSFPTYTSGSVGVVLMSENNDFYHSAIHTIRSQGGSFRLSGLTVAGALLGGGKKALAAEEVKGSPCTAIVSHLDEMGIDRARVRYVGDIDPEGIAMQQQLEDAAGIPPAREVYDLMARLMVTRLDSARPCPQNTSPSQTGSFDLARFCAILDKRHASEVARLVSRGIRIPQEIVSLSVMGEMS